MHDQILSNDELQKLSSKQLKRTGNRILIKIASFSGGLLTEVRQAGF
jgi:hypothetical protein